MNANIPNRPFDAVCYILHGLSGSGKTAWATARVASNLKANIDTRLVSANTFFMRKGVYDFSREWLPAAHEFCKAEFLMSLEMNGAVVIVDNVNAQYKHWRFYEAHAKANGYRVVHLTFGDESDDGFVRFATARGAHGVALDHAFAVASSFESIGGERTAFTILSSALGYVVPNYLDARGRCGCRVCNDCVGVGVDIRHV